MTVYTTVQWHVHTIPLQSYVKYNDACCLIWFRYQPKRLNVGKFLDLWTGIWVSFAPKTYLGCWESGTRQQDGRNFASMHTLDLSPNPSQYLVQFNAGCADFHWFRWCLWTLDHVTGFHYPNGIKEKNAYASWLMTLPGLIRWSSPAWYNPLVPYFAKKFFENPNFG